MGKILSSAQQVVWELPDHRCLQCSVLDKQISWQLQAVLDPLFSEIRTDRYLIPGYAEVAMKQRAATIHAVDRTPSLPRLCRQHP